MPGIHELSIGFSILSGLVGLGLSALSVRAYRANRDPMMGFLTGGFTVFALKSFAVAASLATDTLEHQMLELIDAVGDLGAMVLIITPIFLLRDEKA